MGKIADEPTANVTFLFTDIQGSTAMWERDASRMQSVLARHDEILQSIVKDHGGHVFKMIGDACCAAFPSASDALAAALAAQRAIFTEPWDERSRVRVRMALHTGEVEERGGDYFGPPVNRVARLLSAGHGGQTLLSRATRELLGEELPEGVSTRDMGEKRLKDLKEPERIHQLLAPDLPAEFPPLKTLETSSNEDRYRLIKQIGSGGMAEVYLAYDEFLQREVAFKVLDRKHAQDREAIERFRREARNAASLRHPSIVATHDRGETEDGTYYIVMEYLEGGTLEDLIDEAGPLPPREAAEIAVEISDALQLAHESGVIHRDIKPQNILLTATGDAKVADFGIARAASATTMTQAGSILGTVHYISPEQALGEPATYQSDLYSLGVVLYEMLTGELPYDAETPVGVVMKHVSGLARSPKDANPDVPEELDAVVARLLARDPEERYPDAATLAEELEGIVEELPQVPEAERARGTRTAGGRTGRGTRSGTSGRRLGTGADGMRAVPAGGPDKGRQRVGVLLAVALVLVSVGVIAFVALRQGGGPSAEAPVSDPATVRTLPTEGKLKAGEYRTDEFEPPFSFRVDEDWAAYGAPERSDDLDIVLEDTMALEVPSVLGFYRPQAVVDPKDPEGETLLAAPTTADEWVAWFRDHPHLDAQEPVPVTVGGVRGVRIDSTVSSLPQGADAAALWTLSGGFTVNGEKGWQDRTYILEVDGEPVLAQAQAVNTDRFEQLLPKAQEVLDTVQWGGG